MKEKITAGTISRTIVLALALVNQVLVAFGVQAIPIEDEMVNTLVSTGWTVVSAIVAWWNNNSFRQDSIASDRKLMGERKAG